MSVSRHHGTTRVVMAAAALLSGAIAILLLALGGTPALAAPPVIGEESALAGPNSAIVRSSVDASGEQTSCKLQYVTQAQYQASEYAEATSLPCTEPVPGDTAAHNVLVELAGLAFDTGYDFRFIVLNAAGEEAQGANETFATFGLEAFDVGLLGRGGEPLTQAGGHPYEYTTDIDVTHGTDSAAASGTLKDVEVELPTGLIGDPAAVPKCNRSLVENQLCPGQTQVGEMTVDIGEELGQETSITRPLFNVAAPEGLAAALSAQFDFGNAFLTAHVRSGGDYGIDIDSLNITSVVDIRKVSVTVWGVPGDAAHDAQRVCPKENSGYEYPCKTTLEVPQTPYLSNPTDCTGEELSENARADTYQVPGEYADATADMPAITGCGLVQFDPGLAVGLERASADSPTGLAVDVKVPQNEEPENTATSTLKDATIKFPAGLSVNPSSADGLGSCAEEQVGFTGFTELDPQAEAGVRTAQFTPEPAEASEGEEQEAREGVAGEPKRCPSAAKLGTVSVVTPLLEHPLPGALYLATPHQNPFGSLIAVYLAVYDPMTGVVIKLPGQVQLTQTGQVTTTFDQNPQLPFSELKVKLFGGEKRPAFTTPETCGAYATSSLLEPWSHKGAPGEEGTPDATPESEAFKITEEPGGGACPATEAQAPNSPGFEAGTASPVAGTYSPFVLKLKREDGSQRFDALNVTLPPGMVGKVAGIEQCPQGDIEAAKALSGEGQGAVERAHPSCPAGSEVGVVKVGAGSGTPFDVTGHVYFAGPYDGAPFSFVIVTPAIAGPFDLGTVVVRAALFINPTTAQVSVKSDPFPSILDGIPLDIRSVDVEMTRHEFTLNPTSCDAMAVSGQEASTASQTATLSDRFQVGGCDTLPFKPSFSASTQGKASRKAGAALVVKVAQKPGEANLAKAEVELPIQFSARDSTLNHACSEDQFAANPSACPAESVVGTATAVTPLLAKPLTGPAIYVSHGGAKFPDLDVVLQGEGVTVDLTGKTDIENGRTFSRFETVPDTPISSFELSLPEGSHSALSSNLPSSAKFSFCEQTLTMATRLVGQSGAVHNQQTPVSIEGCKPAIEVLSHKTQHEIATIRVRVPAAGKLTATGKGLQRTSKTAAKAGTVKLQVHLTRHERRLHAKHPHRALKLAIRLRFTPKTGKALSAALSVRIG